MNEEESTLLPQEQGVRNAPSYSSLLPDELDQDQAFELLGRPKPPKLEEILPAGSKLSPNALPDEFSEEEAPELFEQFGLDTNIDPNSLPDELSMEDAMSLVGKLGTMSGSVGVPEVGSQKSSGLATFGFYGPIPTLKGGRITQGYGAPVNYEKSGKHGGIDIGAPKGTPIPSTDNGVVVSVEDHGGKGFGKSVVIKNADGSYSRYSHLNDFRVREGQKVTAGTIIGGVGNTGYVISLGGGGYHLDLRRSR